MAQPLPRGSTQHEPNQLALVAACRAGVLEDVRRLMKTTGVNGAARLKGEGRGRSRVTPLLAAVRYQHCDITEVLLASGADVNGRAAADGDTALHEEPSGLWQLLFAPRFNRNNGTVLRVLLAADADVKALAAGATPLHVAAGVGHASAGRGPGPG